MPEKQLLREPLPVLVGDAPKLHIQLITEVSQHLVRLVDGHLIVEAHLVLQYCRVFAWLVDPALVQFDSFVACVPLCL